MSAPLDALALAERALSLAQATRGGDAQDRSDYREFATAYCTILARALLTERQARLEAERQLTEADAVIWDETMTQGVMADDEFQRLRTEACNRHIDRHASPSDDRRTP